MGRIKLSHGIKPLFAIIFHIWQYRKYLFTAKKHLNQKQSFVTDSDAFIVHFFIVHDTA